MEDQQPATGDLTEESAVDTAAAESEAAPVDELDVDLSDAENGDSSTEDDEVGGVDEGVVRLGEDQRYRQR